MVGSSNLLTPTKLQPPGSTLRVESGFLLSRRHTPPAGQYQKYFFRHRLLLPLSQGIPRGRSHLLDAFLPLRISSRFRALDIPNLLSSGGLFLSVKSCVFIKKTTNTKRIIATNISINLSFSRIYKIFRRIASNSLIKREI